MRRHFLSVVAIFKNEAHVLREWVEHYLAEGVDHFYLIDNGSTDGYAEILKPYIERGLVSLFHETRKSVQDAAYNRFVFPRRNETEWLLICDLDEFAYAKRGRLRDFLIRLGSGAVNAVILPWLEYGSSGLIEQPKSVIGGFRMRRRYDPRVSVVCSKTIVRTRDLMRIMTHMCAIRNWVIVNGRAHLVRNQEWAPQDEDYIRNAMVLMNHYRVQSRNWFFEVKAKRGDAFRADREHWRDEAHFKTFDYNDVEDSTLAKKRGVVGAGV